MFLCILGGGGRDLRGALVLLIYVKQYADLLFSVALLSFLAYSNGVYMSNFLRIHMTHTIMNMKTSCVW